MPNQFEKQHEKAEVTTLCPNCNAAMSGGVCLICISDHDLSQMLASDPMLGQTVNERYRLDAIIGHGGWATVYRGLDLQLDRVVAVKMLHKHWAPDRDKLKRFQREAKALSKVLHKGLVAVFDYGLLPQPFIVLELVEGLDLAALIADRHVTPNEAVQIFVGLCEGLEVLHELGLVHRDIKPANILIDTKSGQPKLLDLGLIKLTAGDEASQATATGNTVGTPFYMSPEQCQGHTVDARSDIYALGCTLYETLTGSPPFKGDNPLELMYRQVNEKPLPLSRAHVDLPAQKLDELEKIVLRCLAKVPEERYQNCAALLTDLQSYQQGLPVKPAQSMILPMAEQPSSQSERLKTALLAVATAVVLLAVGLTILSAVKSAVGKRLSPPTVSSLIDGGADAEQVDRMAATYFMKGDYQRAIPLLEFGINTYKENGKRIANGGEDTYLADQKQHVGKCYLALKQPQKAVPYYRDALRLYSKFGNYRGSIMGEAVSDYAAVLKSLGKVGEADDMIREFRRTNNISSIP